MVIANRQQPSSTKLSPVNFIANLRLNSDFAISLTGRILPNDFGMQDVRECDYQLRLMLAFCFCVQDDISRCMSALEYVACCGKLVLRIPEYFRGHGSHVQLILRKILSVIQLSFFKSLVYATMMKAGGLRRYFKGGKAFLAASIGVFKIISPKFAKEFLPYNSSSHIDFILVSFFASSRLFTQGSREVFSP